MVLIARDQELGDVAARFAAGRRVVSVIGPGGIGKTSLALAVRDRLGPRYPSGAHLVELAAVDRPDAVGGAMAAQLGFASFEALLGSPVDLPALLVVDNCEHVVDAAADALVALVAACDAVSVLVTSRSPLNIPGESIVALGPLPVPNRGTEVAADGAVRLFCERALDAGVALGDDELEQVAELCRRLDGMPLAIELAAARLRVMGLGDLLDRLGDGIDVLARPRHRGAARHRSVAETIGWSMRLLEEGDRTAFARLSVCPGRFDASLAAAVAGSTPAQGLDTVERLVDASLLQVERAPGGVARYRMLEPIRAAAREALVDPDEARRALDGLAQHVHAQVVEMWAQAATRWDADLLPTLLGRFDQIDVALRHSVSAGAEPTRALMLYSALWGVVHQARVDEVLELGALVAERWPDTSVPSGADAAATYAMGHLLCGHTARAVEIAQAALPRADAALFAAAGLRRVLGLAARYEGDHERAATFLTEAAAAAAAHGMVTMDLECRVYAAQDLAAVGRTEEALAMARDAAERGRRGDSVLNEVWARTVEAAILVGSAGAPNGDRSRGAALAAETLAVAEAIAYPFGTTCNLQTLAAADLRAGDLPAAAGAASRLLELFSPCGAGDLRRGLEVAAAVLAAAGRPEAGPVSATAQRLPDTNPMVLQLPATGPVGAQGEVLDRPTVTRLAQRGLRAVQAATAPSDVLAGPESSVEAPVAVGGAAPDAAAIEHPAVFVRSGDVWQLSFAGMTVHVRAAKGMDDLVVLLHQAGREVHCLELAGAGVAEPPTGEVIDEAARRRYEARVRDLQDEIDEAEDRNDVARAERARVELDTLVDHLTAALGLGGKTRRHGGTAERARSAVTHRIRAAVRQIAAVHPPLGRHLRTAVSTGVYCCYRPEVPVRWSL